MTQETKQAVRSLKRTADRARSAELDLHEQIRSSGLPVRAIGEAVGLSKTRVHQIIHGVNR